MATITPASAQAIARLRAYVPPPTQYYSLPLVRRAAVLILLFADPGGNLRVVLTMRSATLKNYAGQAALPGGKADSLAESAFQTARREAFEEIGLPLSDAKLPAPFKIEHLCQLPANLARTELGVRPCVAFLSTEPCASDPARPTPSTEETLIPRLDAKEVEAVFTAPFHNFLRAADEISASASPEAGAEAAGFPAEWYRGTWTNWHESRWRMHNFYVPIAGRTVRRPEQRPPQSTSTSASSAQFDAAAATTSTVRSSLLPYRDHTLASEEDPLAGKSRLRVFGMTARILVDAARIAYGEEPEFEHNAHFGDEDMIARLLRMGRLGAVRKEGDEVTKEDLMAAAKI